MFDIKRITAVKVRCENCTKERVEKSFEYGENWFICGKYEKQCESCGAEITFSIKEQ